MELRGWICLLGDCGHHGRVTKVQLINADQYYSGLEKHAHLPAQASQAGNLHDFNQKRNVDLSLIHCLYGIGPDF